MRTLSVVVPSFVGAGGSFEISSETSGVDVADCKAVVVVFSFPAFCTTSFPVDMIPDTPGSLLKLPVFLAPAIGPDSLTLPVLLVDVLRVY